MSRRAVPIALLALALTACGDAGQAVQPGQWEITHAAGPPNGREVQKSAVTRCLRSSQEDPSRELVLELIGDRCDQAGVKVAGGRISGALQCSEFYAFSAHEEPVAGRYAADTIDFTVDMPLFGQVLRTHVKARRTGDCDRPS